MKMGTFDGSVEEVRDLLENHGLRLEDYLEKPPAPLKTRFLIIPVIVFVSLLCLLVLLSPKLTPIALRFFYILSFGSGTWITVSTQLKYKNRLATFCVAIGAVLMILMAAGLLSPRETADFIKDLPRK